MAAASEKGATAVIAALNRARSAELAAVLQYMSQHYELADKDYGQIASRIKRIAIDEMKHAEEIAERILILNGAPTSKPDREVKKGQSITEIMALNIGLEDEAVRDYNASLHVCQQNSDYESARIFEKLIPDEQEHLLYFQDTQDHIKELGAAFLATQVGGAADKA